MAPCRYPDSIASLSDLSKLPRYIRRDSAILPYVPKFSEKLKSILLSHGIQTVSKPPQKLGSLLSSFKDAIEQ